MADPKWSKEAENELLKADKRLSKTIFPDDATMKDPYGARARVSRNVNALRAGIDPDTIDREAEGYMGNASKHTELSALDHQVQLVKAKRLREGKK